MAGNVEFKKMNLSMKKAVEQAQPDAYILRKRAQIENILKVIVLVVGK